MKPEFSWHALEDLKRLRAFIHEDNPVAACRISTALRASIRHLADHPEIGTELEDMPGVRRWIAARNYEARDLVD